MQVIIKIIQVPTNLNIWLFKQANWVHTYSNTNRQSHYSVFTDRVVVHLVLGTYVELEALEIDVDSEFRIPNIDPGKPKSELKLFDIQNFYDSQGAHIGMFEIFGQFTR